jgi:thiamine-phosphate pyrophosphorylase
VRADIDLSLYLVTDERLAAAAGHDLVELVREAAENGVTVVQVREKTASARQFLDTVMRVAEVIPEHVALIVNDRVDVFLAARAAGARVAGVHVGQSDLPVEAVRGLVGDAIVGVSASTDAELLRAATSGVRIDYVGVGTVHATTTKSDAPPPLGIDGVARSVATLAAHRGAPAAAGPTRTPLPVVAIGGVSLVDLSGLHAAGAAGAAVVSAICSAPDPGAASRALRSAWEAAA